MSTILLTPSDDPELTCVHCGRQGVDFEFQTRGQGRRLAHGLHERCPAGRAHHEVIERRVLEPPDPPDVQALIYEVDVMLVETSRGEWRAVQVPRMGGGSDTDGQWYVYAGDSCILGYRGPPLGEDDARLIARAPSLLRDLVCALKASTQPTEERRWPTAPSCALQALFAGEFRDGRVIDHGEVAPAREAKPKGTIGDAEARIVYRVYEIETGRVPHPIETFERIHTELGGFQYWTIARLLGHEPKTWRPA